MNSNSYVDPFYMSLDWDDDSSTESDSGISSISSDSISSQFSHQDNTFIGTMSSIASDISIQPSIYSKTLIDFTLSGLTSTDLFIRRSAAVFMWQLFRACNMPCYDSLETKEKMTLLLKINENIVQSLEIALKTDSFSSQMLYWVSGCFHYISRTPIGCSQLLKGNIGILLSMLGSELPSVVYYSITAVHNILLTSPCPLDGENLINCAGFILNRINLVKSITDQTQIKLMAICIDCLSNLAYQNNLIKAQISSHSSAISIIINNLFHNINNEKLLLLGMRLLKILSTVQETKTSISNSTVFPLLITQVFRSKIKVNSQIWLMTICTLRNLSDILFQDVHLTVYRDALIHICEKFQQINRSENDLILQCAAGILANASCDCPHNKMLLVKMKVHETILTTLSVSKNKFQRWSGETLEAMYRCLHHLCSNYDKASTVIERCLKTDVQFLHNFTDILLIDTDRALDTEEVPISWSILRAWLGLTRHLCIHQMNLASPRGQLNQNNFLETINLNLKHFQIQLDTFLKVTSPSFSNAKETTAVQYLNQLHSSILNIISITTSKTSMPC